MFFDDEGCLKELKPQTLTAGPEFLAPKTPSPDNQCAHYDEAPAKATGRPLQKLLLMHFRGKRREEPAG